MAHRRKLKQYRGCRDRSGSPAVYVAHREGLAFRATEYPLRHHVRHSPDGFEWGYGGSGPTELARCILIDHFHGDTPRPRLLYGEPERVEPTVYVTFAHTVIATIRSDTWVLTSHDIDRWLGAQGLAVDGGNDNERGSDDERVNPG